ncbi:hypothetical protein M3J09_007640 [Ascochyta lentis]
MRDFNLPTTIRFYFIFNGAAVPNATRHSTSSIFPAQRPFTMIEMTAIPLHPTPGTPSFSSRHQHAFGNVPVARSELLPDAPLTISHGRRGTAQDPTLQNLDMTYRSTTEA